MLPKTNLVGARFVSCAESQAELVVRLYLVVWGQCGPQLLLDCSTDSSLPRFTSLDLFCEWNASSPFNPIWQNLELLLQNLLAALDGSQKSHCQRRLV